MINSLNWLEQRQLLLRTRDTGDWRRVIVELTDTARVMLSSGPPLVRVRFSSRFSQLADWEQSLLLASLQRIAHRMDGDDSIPLAPFLSAAESIEQEEQRLKPTVVA